MSSAAGDDETMASQSLSAAAPIKAVVKSVDMVEDMQHRAVETASAALEKYNVEKDIAMHIKKEFDRLYGTTWHCVVGKNFVTHGASDLFHHSAHFMWDRPRAHLVARSAPSADHAETKNFIYFYLGPIAILLWKTS